MPKTAVQTPICDICGAEIREGSLFCYNCGGSLKQEVVLPPRNAEAKAGPPVSKNGTPRSRTTNIRETPRRKRPDRSQAEVVWAPREGISMIYVTAGAVLLIIALTLFILAMWLK